MTITYNRPGATPAAGIPAVASGRVVVPPGISHPRLKVLRQQGTEVIVFDLRGSNEAEVVALCEGVYRKFMDAQVPGAGLRTLVEVRDTPPSPAATTALRNFAQLNKPCVKASAVVTTKAVHRLAVGTIAMFTKRNIKAFDDDKAALAWLATQ